MRRAALSFLFLIVFCDRPPAVGDPNLIANPDSPWGNLQTTPIYIQPGLDKGRLEIVLSLDSEWHFDLDSIEKVSTTLARLGFDSSWQERILREAPPAEIRPGRIVLKPPQQLILDLPGPLRQRLYLLLKKAKHKWNLYEAALFVENPQVTLPAVKRNFSSEVFEIFTKLLWKDGACLNFSDLPVVLPLIQTETQKMQFISLLRTRRSHISSLFLPKGSTNLLEMREYWSASGRNPGAAHLIDSLFSSNNGYFLKPVLDVSHLLPGVPRKLLHHYPPLEMPQGDDMPDCFWTALNFFNDEATDRVYGIYSLEEYFESNFVEVEPPLDFGDLILLSEIEVGKQERMPAHACNYLYKNFVYTKNGKSLKSPWVIQEFSQVLNTYSTEGIDLWVQYFRKRK